MKKVIIVLMLVLFCTSVYAGVISPFTLGTFGYGSKVSVGSTVRSGSSNVKLVDVGEDSYGKFGGVDVDGQYLKIYENDLVDFGHVQVYITRVVFDDVDYVNWYLGSEEKKGIYEKKWWYDVKEGDVIKLKTKDVILVEGVNSVLSFMIGDERVVLGAGQKVEAKGYMFYLEGISFDVNSAQKTGLLVVTKMGGGDLVVEEVPETVYVSSEVETCEVKGEKLEVGERSGLFYCGDDLKLHFVKLEGSCVENYECENNLCVDSLCYVEEVELTWFEKLVNFFVRFK